MTSPPAMASEVLRFFAVGGLLGGASATVAFFLPRTMSAGGRQLLDIREPILECGDDNARRDQAE